MSDNRDLTETFHQKVSSLPVSIFLDISNPHEYVLVLLSIVAYNFLLKVYI